MYNHTLAPKGQICVSMVLNIYKYPEILKNSIFLCVSIEIYNLEIVSKNIVL